MRQMLANLDIEIPPCPTQRELDAFWSITQDRLASSLAERVPDGSTVVYVDYPVHGNTGDQMLMLATELWFRRGNFQVLGRWHIDNFRFPKLPLETIILCHAGGNMGDLYRYQKHREAIVQAYPNHRIVFLPQTIYYRSPERLRQSAEKLRQHDDLHLFVREQKSFELALAEFTTTTLTLVPDMAAFLYPLPSTLNCEFAPPRHRDGILYFMRRDWEWTNVTPIPKRRNWIGLPDVLSLLNPFWRGRPAPSVSASEKAICIDWHETAPLRTYQAWVTLASVYLLGRFLPAEWFNDRWQRLVRQMVIGGARSVLNCRCLVTNRLHAHLLACMLGTPSVVLDNSYGKCSAYFDTWHSGLKFAKFFDQGIVKSTGVSAL